MKEHASRTPSEPPRGDRRPAGRGRDTPLRLLLIEDSESDAELLLREIRKAGHELRALRVDTVEATAEAMDNGPWDIVIADYQLPGFNGLAALSVVKERDPDVPFLVFSGVIDEALAVTAMKAGASDCISKGNLARLIPALERELEGAEARRERGRLSKALGKSEEKFRIVFEGAPVGITLNEVREEGKPGRFLEANAMACRLLGLSREELLEKTPLDIIAEPEEYFASTFNDLKSERDSTFEVSGKAADGSMVPLEIASRVIDLQGEKVLFSLLRDITERRKSEEEKARLEEQLRHSQKMEAVGLLAGGIAHDFNNLLSVIMVSAELPLMKLQEHDPHYGYFQDILQAAEHSAALTRQLLLFAKKQPMKMASCNLNAILNHLRKILGHLIGEDIRLVLDLQQDLPRLTGDVSSLEQVITNLVVNARDALPQGGAITLRTRAAAAGDRRSLAAPGGSEGAFVSLVVEDTGTGIAQEHLAHIFEPFYTTKALGKGTGLGLSVVHGIVERHGGWIETQSTPGEGTRFTISLPAGGEELDETGKKPLQPDKIKEEGATILVVEDNESLRNIALRILNFHGFNVLQAASVAAALEVLSGRGGEIDLLFSDMVLPDGNGTQLVEKALALNPGIGILLTSGYADERAGWKMLQEKSLAFLPKPYTASALLKTLREILERGAHAVHSPR